MIKSRKLLYFISIAGAMLMAMHLSAAEPVHPQSPEAIKRMADELEAARKAREANRDQNNKQAQEETEPAQAAGTAPVTTQELEQLRQQCEEARQKQLAPLKQTAINECIAKKVKSPAECEKFYKDFGESGITESGSFRQRRFHDIPECQAYYDAEKTLKK